MRALIASLRSCLSGDHAQTIDIVRNALAEPARDPETKFYLARHLARSGAGSTALEVIRELIAEGFSCSIALERDPWLQPLGAERGFKDTLCKILQREAEARAAFEGAGGSRFLP